VLQKREGFLVSSLEDTRDKIVVPSERGGTRASPGNGFLQTKSPVTYNVGGGRADPKKNRINIPKLYRMIKAKPFSTPAQKPETGYKHRGFTVVPIRPQ